MAYLALYRKYRPKDFNGVVGQDHIVTTLVNQIKTGRLGHAYLFTGTRGTGKTSLAKIFARAINCQNPQNGSPCGECSCCNALLDPSNVDVMEIDAASNNGVEQIRDLKEKVQYAPVQCKYKVYIIDEVHMLTGAAFNALLKTLEEPPTHAVFILATTEVHKIPATILSRCMRFDFKLIPTEKIANLIAKIYDEQGKEYEREAVFAIAKAGEGSIRDALSIADIALSYSDGKLTYKQVTEILGATDTDKKAELTQKILTNDSSSVLSIINDLCLAGKSISVLTKDVTETLRNILVVKTCDKPNDILNLPQDTFIKLESIAKLSNTDRILRVVDIFSTLESELRYSVHQRIVFESAVLRATRPELDYNLDALLGRIKTLEDKIKDISLGNIAVVEKSEEKVESKFTAQTEKFIDKPTVETTVKQEKVRLQSVSVDELKGKLLFGLRKNNNEMLWNFMQDVIVSVSNNTLILSAKNEDDCVLIEKPDNIDKIKTALLPISDFDVEVKATSTQKTMNEVDQATERIKKMFGDDMVIIKD